MRTLVIHPLDNSTTFLQKIYEDINCVVISSTVEDKFLRKEIEQADSVIMLGHGVPRGLIGKYTLILDKTHADLLREKTDNIYIWCNADQYVKENKLTGMASGMIISEAWEAKVFNITSSLLDVHDSNIQFAKSVKNAVNLDYKDMPGEILRWYNHISYKVGDDVKIRQNRVIDFNRKNIHSFTNGIEDKGETNEFTGNFERECVAV